MSFCCQTNLNECRCASPFRLVIRQSFRYFYQRADLPCAIQHRTNGQTLKWFIDDFQTLNVNFYLPIFVDGLAERKYPYSFIAFQGEIVRMEIFEFRQTTSSSSSLLFVSLGTLDLIEKASNKIDSETIGQLIQPLRRALNTNDLKSIRHVLIVLQRLVRGNDGALGIVLVSYFRQILPIINRIREKYSENCRDQSSEIVRLIDETLVILEEFGGPDSFLNIKYSIPTYEQQIDPKRLTSSQTDAILRPFCSS